MRGGRERDGFGGFGGAEVVCTGVEGKGEGEEDDGIVWFDAREDVDG